MSNKRVRSFALISYLDESVINFVISQHDNISHYAYIYHDKDDCESHFHIVLTLVNATTSSAVLSWFQCSNANTFIEETFSLISIFEYLTHENQPDKFHYDRNLIVSDNIGYFLDIIKDGTEKNVAVSILEDILSGKFTLQDMAKRYGRDYVINYQKYNSYAMSMKRQATSLSLLRSIYEHFRCNIPIQDEIIEQIKIFFDDDNL